MLKFKGCQHFRQRLVCSTLSNRPIRIDGIREQDENPGVRDYEACLLRLLEKVTDGCVVEINETGALCAFSMHYPTASCNYCLIFTYCSAHGPDCFSHVQAQLCATDLD